MHTGVFSLTLKYACEQMLENSTEYYYHRFFTSQLRISLDNDRN